MTKSKAHPVDIHVGSKLRSRRLIVGLSQHETAVKAGITFQQLQKYERGDNRVGASRLYELSKILNINIAYFFEDYDKDSSTNYDNILNKILSNNNEVPSTDNRETLNLIRGFYAIKDKNIRQKLLALISSVANLDRFTAIDEKIDEKEIFYSD